MHDLVHQTYSEADGHIVFFIGAFLKFHADVCFMVITCDVMQCVVRKQCHDNDLGLLKMCWTGFI